MTQFVWEPLTYCIIYYINTWERISSWKNLLVTGCSTTPQTAIWLSLYSFYFVFFCLFGVGIFGGFLFCFFFWGGRVLFFLSLFMCVLWALLSYNYTRRLMIEHQNCELRLWEKGTFVLKNTERKLS